MEGFDPLRAFDEDVAEDYDALCGRGEDEATTAFLAELAGDGPALELAIGTGRVALPLAARGIRVDGVDSSLAMVAKLREKPGGDQLAVTIGDFAQVPVDGRYRLVYVVFNTLFNLLTQDDQVRCFEHVAAHLVEDGSFVVEGQVPHHLAHLPDCQYVHAEQVGVDEVWLDVGRYDPVTQRLEETHVGLSPDGVRLQPIVLRYAWPSELDLMARLAGLRLTQRWAGWNREPFTPASPNCISVYRR
jgi:Methyltransferase domain